MTMPPVAGLTTGQASRLAEEAVSRCREIARITDVPGETTRTFLSDGMRRANAVVSAWMQQAGCAVRMDAAGNLRGTLPGNGSDARTFVLASHLDTVPNAGAFDGVLGITMALALASSIGPGTLPFDLELIAFSEEEGVRFGFPFIGSRALAGTLDTEMLARHDAQGVSVREALVRYGLDPEQLTSAQIQQALGYLEFHIEQGPALESEGLPLGVVETIAGQSRLLITFTGAANHAGTTPMHLRKDALCAAAEWIAEVERVALNNRALVATCGSIQAVPNAGNVIAGEVRVSLDVRSALDLVRTQAVQDLCEAANRIAGKRGLSVDAKPLLQQEAVPLDRNLLRLLEDAVDAAGTPIRRMVSGAGHDAMVLAPHMPAAMLFLRTPGGLSHHPEENVASTDVALALQVGDIFLRDLAKQEAAR